MENFLQVLIENAQVREDFLKQTTPEGAYLVARPYLDGLTMSEFIESLLGVARVMDGVKSGEIPDEHLTTVSGGTFDKVMKVLKNYVKEVDIKDTLTL